MIGVCERTAWTGYGRDYGLYVNRVTGNEASYPGCRWRAPRSHGQRRVVHTAWQRSRRGERDALSSVRRAGSASILPANGRRRFLVDSFTVS